MAKAKGLPPTLPGDELDILSEGNSNLFRLIAKESSIIGGWMRTIEAMEVERGCVILVTTRQASKQGGTILAESMTYVPDVRLTDTGNGHVKFVTKYP